MKQKIAQCRYCTNSSNEGSGYFISEYLWICKPCVRKIVKTVIQLKGDLLELME